MNDEQALVDEIVRRVLEQLSGVADTLRTETSHHGSSPPAPASSPSASPTLELLPPDPPRTEPVFAETNSSGRFLPPPTGWNSPPVEVTTSTVSVVSTPAPAPVTPSVSVSVAPLPAVTPSLALPPASPAVAASPGMEEEVVISERVITAEVLLRDLRGARRVVIAPKALLTPTANDVIRTRRLDIVRQSAQATPSSTSRRRWVILVGQSLPAVTAAVGAWRTAGGRLETALVGTAAEAAARAISAICRGEADEVLVISAQPESVACLANRNEAVRGVVLVEAAAVARLRESLRPNVWVVDAAPRGGFDLSSLLSQLDR
ncbi:MAG: hypothetical protein ACK6D3_09000 [Planctomycetaceae bacterium]|jgi:hypothetical protein